MTQPVLHLVLIVAVGSSIPITTALGQGQNLTPFMRNEEVFHVTAPRNQETRIWNFSTRYQRRVGDYCQTDSIPEINVAVPPANGTVRLVRGSVKQPECPNPIEGIQVFYRPNSGFSGQDRIIFQRKGDASTNGIDRPRVVNVTVQ